MSFHRASTLHGVIDGTVWAKIVVRGSQRWIDSLVGEAWKHHLGIVKCFVMTFAGMWLFSCDELGV